MKYFLSFALSLAISFGYAQNKVKVSGMVADTAGTALPYSTVSLLYTTDSTLAYFGITNGEGLFEISNVAQDKYILQASYLGFANQYRDIKASDLESNLDLGVIGLGLKAVNLEGVEISGTQSPILIKNDTIEYNASSFRVKTNDNVEDLLKKMPGIEVDREGNIKAQGEDVQKVTVDGKEFFGNDPKMATRNLPANSVKKVQVFDKKSDVAEFTGVDDGERSKTINLELKDDKKKGTFGEVKAGYGTNERYELGGSAFNFNPKRQLSLLARQNNINDYGFTISDYLNFQGGMRNAGSMSLSINGNDNSIPLNFGQQQYGNLSSGALGANASFELSKDNNLSVSYMLNGSDRLTTTDGTSTQFLRDSELNIEENERNAEENMSHVTNLRWINDLDSLTRVIITGSANLTDAGTNNNSFRQTENESGDRLNYNQRLLGDNSDGYTLTGGAKLVRKSAAVIGRNVTGSLDLSLNSSQQTTNWENEAAFAPDFSQQMENYFRRDQQDGSRINVGAEWNEPLNARNFIEFSGGYTLSQNEFIRNQTFQEGENTPNEAPKDDVLQTAGESKAEVKWKYVTENTTFAVGVGGTNLTLDQEYVQGGVSTLKTDRDFQYLLPSLRLRHTFTKGKRLNFNYSTSINYPRINSIAPIQDLTNPLFISSGNINLTPEYQHSGRLFYMIYDAFSFTSLFLSANATYTSNNIIQSREVNPTNFVQTQRPINYKDASNYSASASFNTPISKLGMKIRLEFEESYGLSYSLINGQENRLTTNTHVGSIMLENKNKDKFDVAVGTEVSYTDSRYSVQQAQNAIYVRNTYFADVTLFLSESLVLNSSFDYNLYRNSNFGEGVNVPLWSASATYSFLKNKRGSLTLKAFDLLNKNTGVEQFSSENMIGQQVSNILQQYYMLTFSYKLSMTKEPQGRFHIRMRR